MLKHPLLLSELTVMISFLSFKKPLGEESP